jgi:hypothetical protein
MKIDHNLTVLPVLRWSAAILALSCPLSAEVFTDFDPATDFTRYKTYSFVHGLELEKSGLLKDPETRERIKNFIAGGLDPRGLTEVPLDQHHDLAIRYWVGFEDKQSVTVNLAVDPLWVGWGGYPPYWTGPWAYSYDEYIVRNYREGTLIVDLIDTATNLMVWRTFFEQDLSDRVKAYDQLTKELARTFARLPPSDEEKLQMEHQRKKLESKYK